MPTLRESMWPILAITIASAVVMLLIAPLEATEWAAGIRAGLSAEGTEAIEGGAPSGLIAIIGPLIKITILMGIPALLTFSARRLIGQLSKRRLA